MKTWIVLVALGAGLWAFNRDKPAHWNGIPAPRVPVQTSANLPAPFRYKDYSVKPLAHYAVTAVVLSRDRYRFDRGAEVSPVDLALGWGSMSIAGVLNELDISQGGRFYEYRWSGDAPLEPEQIVAQSANTHCIPANPQVASKLLRVKRHELVTLEGYLVEVAGADGSVWRSSLTRDDSGGGACELVWVTGVTRKRI